MAFFLFQGSKFRSFIVFLCFSIGLSFLACGGGDEQPTEPDESSPQVTSVEVSPDSAHLTALAAEQDFDATARDQNGNEMSGVSFSWSLSPDSVGAVDSNGTVTAEANGEATVEAELDGVTGSASLTVDQEVSSVAVAPDSASFDSTGETVDFDATAKDHNGNQMAGVTFTWSVKPDSVATVDSVGTVTAQKSGSATVQAKASDVADSIADSARIVVEDPEEQLNEEFKGLDGVHHPPDLDLAAGPSSLMAISIEKVALLGKDGTPIEVKTGPLYGSVKPEDTGRFDPRVAYDPLSGRFFLLYAALGKDNRRDCEAGECRSFFLLAVSKSSSPTNLPPDGWHLYSFNASIDGSTPVAATLDFPRMGIGPDAVVLTTIMVPSDLDTREAYTKIRVLDKEKLIRGDSVGWVDTTLHEDPISGDGRPLGLQPVARQPAADGFYLVSNPWSMTCDLPVWRLTGLPDNPELEQTVARADGLPGSGVSCRLPPENPPQPNGAPRLKAGGAMQSEVRYQNGSVWLAYTVPFDGESGTHPTAVRWAEIDVRSWPTVSFRQDTVIKRENSWLFFPSMAVNRRGDMALVYGRSDTTTYPTVHVARRPTGLSPNALGSKQQIKGSTTSLQVTQGSVARYGDYFGASYDPQDDSIWILGEYVRASDAWAGWIGNIQF